MNEFDMWLQEVDDELQDRDEIRGNLPYRLHQWWDMWDHGITPEDAASAAMLLQPECTTPQPSHPAYDDGTVPCHDCGINTLPVNHPNRAEYYMVTNAIWNAHGCGESYLCIGCLEVRMGRMLTAQDFSDVPLNDLTVFDTDRYAWSYRTPRLVSRLMATN